jgi:hypothetical protein
MRTSIILAFTSIILFSGCLLSFYPFYTDETLTTIDDIDGVWTGENESWEFTSEENRAYSLIHTDEDGNKAYFSVHFAKVGNETFIDMYPGDGPNSLKPSDDANPQIKEQENEITGPSTFKNSFWAFHLVPFHSFGKIIKDKDKVTIKIFDHDFLEKKVSAKEYTIKYEKNDNNILLTASSQDLQKYALKYSNNPDAFSDDINLTRNK